MQQEISKNNDIRLNGRYIITTLIIPPNWNSLINNAQVVPIIKLRYIIIIKLSMHNNGRKLVSQIHKASNTNVNILEKIIPNTPLSCVKNANKVLSAISSIFSDVLLKITQIPIIKNTRHNMLVSIYKNLYLQKCVYTLYLNVSSNRFK